METIKRKAGRPAGTFKNPVRKTHPLHNTWSGMRQRCNNPKSHVWKYYGGRGIKVCERWNGKDGFLNFYSDMAAGWRKGLTIDRHPNGSGNYEPGNCRWATMQQQTETRRKTGVSPDPNSLRQRAIAAGLAYHVVVNRVYYLGWTEERALSTPKMKIGAQPGHRNYRKSNATAADGLNSTSGQFP
jgi:hypothetical protein